MRWPIVAVLLVAGCRAGDTGEAASAPPAPAPSRMTPQMAPSPTPMTEFEEHVADLRRRAPEGFTIVVERPFVVLGDESPERVHERAETVRWSVKMLKQDFFTRDPEHVIDIWLFAGKESYERHARELFGDEPSTPYGYYASGHHALIMNISTGGGTLVHEMVHPFMEANVPDCPAWLNEGLGSLFEQSAERDGHIVGLTNWRLAGLKDAIRDGRVPAFAELVAMNDRAFYGDGSGVHYAASRYLLYYLQEQGLLRRFFQAFLAGRERDPSGWRALVDTLGEKDMVAFQKRWQRYATELHFP